MISETRLQRVANDAAHEILREARDDEAVHGALGIDFVASVILGTLQGQLADQEELLNLHAKAVEAMHLLSTPPPDGASLTPERLQSLLSERLDSIRTLAGKLMDTTASVRAAQAEE